MGQKIEWIENWKYYDDYEVSKDYKIKKDSLSKIYSKYTEINFRKDSLREESKLKGKELLYPYDYYASYYVVGYRYYVYLAFGRVDSESYDLVLHYYKGKLPKYIRETIGTSSAISYVFQIR